MEKNKIIAKCKYCKTKNSKYSVINGATTNLWTHLKKVHPALLGISKSQRTLDLYKFDDRISEVIEGRFKNIIEKISKFHVVSTDTIKRDIMTKYIEMRTNVKIELHEILGKIAFSLDLWTSSVVKAYMGVIVHFIDQNWQLQQKTLDFFKIEGSYTGKNLANELIQVFEFYNIESKINGITVDNATNNDMMIYHLELWAIDKDISFCTNNHFHCFAHVVNLSVQAALKQLKDEIDKIRNLIIKSHSSPQRHQKFLEISSLNNIKNLSPILDVPTRWNSIYNMIQRALNLRV
ncbi:zinc finger bed domain-containing protein ricesleeper 2-like [Gigaspora margarita]|uniref:Zinc finger bed domain-containing protein ricesleeper 2-like n=1 Tax=Gigaspora margarita TaxID=4874 RepID=A0A8H4B2J6_GIGMA|nr:zinc finger bed domain-containing protein ricesleeper 2-like [Gigaspora margarita]